MRLFCAMAIYAVSCCSLHAESKPSLLTPDPTSVQLVSETRLPLTDVQNVPREFQVNPFEALVTVSFNREKTVGEAVAVLLNFAGYDFRIHGDSIDPMAIDFYQMPLPDVHRSFENVRLVDVLLSLASEGYTLVLDHSARAASVDMTPAKRLLIRVRQERG